MGSEGYIQLQSIVGRATIARSTVVDSSTERID
jgi:hypothetical protein